MSTLNGREWVENLAQKLQEAFGKRLLFVGLQGSFARGESTPQSDIDAVVILDKLTPADLHTYKNLLNQMPHQDKACGFISGAEELKNWPRQELFQFKYDTQDIYGHLEPLLPELTRQDALCAMQTGAGAIYHLLCHTYLHGNVREVLPSLCKTAFFVLQAQYYLKTGLYVASKAKLLPLLTTKEQSILQVSLNGGEINNPQEICTHLLEWTSHLLKDGDML